jgi:hypothetical protein
MVWHGLQVGERKCVGRELPMVGCAVAGEGQTRGVPSEAFLLPSDVGHHLLIRSGHRFVLHFCELLRYFFTG